MAKCKCYRLDTEKPSYVPCDPDEATHLELNLPGPITTRILPIIIKGSRSGTGCWSWNGSLDTPTIKPSILTKTYIADVDIICHTWINDGKVIFLDDCSHELAGQTLDLLEVE